MKALIFRPLQLATVGFVLILVAFLMVISAMTWTQYRRLERGRAHIDRVQVFQRAFLTLAVAATDETAATSPGDSAILDQLLKEVDDLIALATPLDTATADKLGELRALLENRDFDPATTLPNALKLFREVVLAEAEDQERLLTDMESNTRAELRLTIFAPLALAGLGGLILLFIRLRILRPLGGLGFLVTRLAQGEFTPVPVEKVDPLLHPLFANYNRLVTRLEELEQEHRAHAESLEREVRMATEALLEQQRGLARAERLAATDELKNPLAGIQLTLTNLKRELDDVDKIGRLDLVTGELTRLSRLLKELLDMSRHVPEPPRSIDLAASVGQLLTLTRYQLPPRVRLESDIDDGLICHLPEDRLRQALLNLILNASQALDETAGTVMIEARAEGKTLRVTVSDDGPGFSQEVLHRIPRPFLSTAERGTGLGLTMVHRFARDLGGELELSNREPHGARVTVTLPDCVNHG
jgi:two-component system NtrC family sensor kinase